MRGCEQPCAVLQQLQQLKQHWLDCFGCYPTSPEGAGSGAVGVEVDLLGWQAGF